MHLQSLLRRTTTLAVTADRSQATHATTSQWTWGLGVGLSYSASISVDKLHPRVRRLCGELRFRPISAPSALAVALFSWHCPSIVHTGLCFSHVPPWHLVAGAQPQLQDSVRGIFFSVLFLPCGRLDVV